MQGYDRKISNFNLYFIYYWVCYELLQVLSFHCQESSKDKSESLLKMYSVQFFLQMNPRLTEVF